MDKTKSSDESADTICWSPRFSVGSAVLDDQHKRLIDMINKVIAKVAHNANREVISEVLDDMVEYADVHFQDEEALLQKHGYPGCSNHEDSHLEFREESVRLCRSYRDDYESTRVDLQRYLKRWLLDHILIEDMKYKEFLRDKGVS